MSFRDKALSTVAIIVAIICNDAIPDVNFTTIIVKESPCISSDIIDQ